MGEELFNTGCIESLEPRIPQTLYHSNQQNQRESGHGRVERENEGVAASAFSKPLAGNRALPRRDLILKGSEKEGGPSLFL